MPWHNKKCIRKYIDYTLNDIQNDSMHAIKNIIKFLLLLMLIFMFAGTACTSSKKAPYYGKRIKSSQSHSSQLGRNRYYYSPTYQKKLNKSFKRK